MVGTDPTAVRWHFVVDNLDIHRAESLVRFAAAASGLDLDRREKGRRGPRHTRQSRATFLRDPPHRLVFHYIPKHRSWPNPIAIWLSIPARTLLRRGSCTSVEDREANVLAFIAYDNRTMAKPSKWPYQGKALVA